MKKLLSSALVAVTGLAALAQETTPTGPIAYDGSVAKTIVENSSTTLTNFITGAGVVVAGIIVAGLAIWGGISLVSVLKRAFSTGKGR